ncbi:hypothetical protein BGW80DRAFT_92305 [Lactifluus volemus]|nr:hypothetical protein BGW80DRAFT_92305 [Lactifluus volemus]
MKGGEDNKTGADQRRNKEIQMKTKKRKKRKCGGGLNYGRKVELVKSSERTVKTSDKVSGLVRAGLVLAPTRLSSSGTFSHTHTTCLQTGFLCFHYQAQPLCAIRDNERSLINNPFPLPPLSFHRDLVIELTGTAFPCLLASTLPSPPVL